MFRRRRGACVDNESITTTKQGRYNFLLPVEELDGGAACARHPEKH